jgi:hypothetical protein
VRLREHGRGWNLALGSSWKENQYLHQHMSVKWARPIYSHLAAEDWKCGGRMLLDSRCCALRVIELGAASAKTCPSGAELPDKVVEDAHIVRARVCSLGSPRAGESRRKVSV